MEFKSYKELIEYLNTFKTDQEKLKVLFDYFLQNVKYNYEKLKLCKLQNIADDIENGYDATKEEDREIVMNKVQNLFSFSKEYIDALKQEYGKKVPTENSDDFWIKDLISATNYLIFSSCANPQFKNGLLKVGVCSDYASFISKICDELGIYCQIVRGKSTDVRHAWNIIKIDGEERHFDITYELFIRDQYQDWDKKAKSGDWLNVSLEDMQKLQPTRIVINVLDKNFEI